MDNLLPIFPLNLVVYPGEKLNLHIFEDRYIQLIEQINDSGKSFGIPPYLNGIMSDVGTEMLLTSIEKIYDNGNMDIKTVGISVFNINQTYDQYPGMLYSGASVEHKDIDMDPDPVKNIQILELLQQLYNVLLIKRSLKFNPRESISYSVGHHAGLNVDQELELLKLAKEEERQNYLIDHLSRFIPKAMQMEDLRKKIQMNGYFKNLDPLNF